MSDPGGEPKTEEPTKVVRIPWGVYHVIRRFANDEERTFGAVIARAMRLYSEVELKKRAEANP